MLRNLIAFPVTLVLYIDWFALHEVLINCFTQRVTVSREGTYTCTARNAAEEFRSTMITIDIRGGRFICT